jgi:ligand-binding SRPBCC domain-containing protein
MLMPSFQVRTQVNAPMQYVWSRFDETLLAKLSPPFPQVRILAFDGCQTGDQVSLELNLLLYKPIWTSQISSSEQTENYCVFVDEGIVMPFGLRYWRHAHRIEKNDTETCTIVDQISFNSNYWLLDYLLIPFLWGMIVYRIPLYKRFLTKPI